MKNREMIESYVKAQGLTIKSWDEKHENGDSAVIGRFKVVEENESAGLYSGDEGDLMMCVVGREDLGNRRVGSWLETEYGAYDVDDLSLVDQVS